jgi:hypothetical protein
MARANGKKDTRRPGLVASNDDETSESSPGGGSEFCSHSGLLEVIDGRASWSSVSPRTTMLTAVLAATKYDEPRLSVLVRKPVVRGQKDCLDLFLDGRDPWNRLVYKIGRPNGFGKSGGMWYDSQIENWRIMKSDGGRW